VSTNRRSSLPSACIFQSCMLAHQHYLVCMLLAVSVCVRVCICVCLHEKMNKPNKLLFVGEALVGNDGIDQLNM